MRIKLFNRCGANMYLYRNDDATPIEPNIYEWELTVDSRHNYVLEYCRYMGEYENTENLKHVKWLFIEAIDPSGGPFISVGDEFENKYKIVKINSTKSIWISERDNN